MTKQSVDASRVEQRRNSKTGASLPLLALPPFPHVTARRQRLVESDQTIKISPRSPLINPPDTFCSTME
ncbi:hypothetical protein RB195_003925 [Necator americanus]|uniref:Uncharacterized protein n=1 Tax=Necator americanus TaxID=51031 RepID=A0ABR1DR15_NECAM